MSDLAARVRKLEEQLGELRPELHFPSTATLEHRLRWLEIVVEELRNGHRVRGKLLDDDELEGMLGRSVYVKPDRITLHSLTADPASVAAGDMYFRSDLSKAKLAVDTAVANTKLVCSEAEADSKISTHAGNASAHHAKTTDASEITSGRFGMARMPDMTSGYVMRGAGAGVDPTASQLAHGDLSGIGASDHHAKPHIEAKIKSDASYQEDVTWTTAFDTAPAVAAACAGSTSLRGYANVDSYSTTGATITTQDDNGGNIYVEAGVLAMETN